MIHVPCELNPFENKVEIEEKEIVNEFVERMRQNDKFGISFVENLLEVANRQGNEEIQRMLKQSVGIV